MGFTKSYKYTMPLKKLVAQGILLELIKGSSQIRIEKGTQCASMRAIAR